MPESKAISSGDNVDTIEQVVREIERLESGVDWWNTVTLLMTFVAALSAAGLFVSQWLTVRRGKELAATQQTLINLKDLQLRTELKEKDDKLALELKGKDIKLAEDLADKDLKIGEANKTASDAKAAQQRVEIELAKYQERAAIAEANLLELQKKVADRRLTPAQRDRLIELLRDAPKGTFGLSYNGQAEPAAFANDIAAALIAAGWTQVGGMSALSIVKPGGELQGVFLMVNDLNRAPLRAGVLQKALEEIGILTDGFPEPVGDDSIVVHVAAK